ncbi:hypothetical protein J1614_011095 [Plenodomus biglobosus]|nr:hypothetical protein J1614_011095 [Plenodomus biglobosus]
MTVLAFDAPCHGKPAHLVKLWLEQQQYLPLTKLFAIETATVRHVLLIFQMYVHATPMRTPSRHA